MTILLAILTFLGGIASHLLAGLAGVVLTVILPAIWSVAGRVLLALFQAITDKLEAKFGVSDGPSAHNS